MASPTFANGKVCYIQIPSTDPNRSSAFYQRAFGWKLRTRSDGEIAFDDGVNQVSGTWIKHRKPSVEPGLLIYIMVDDIHETIKLIEESGGKIVQGIGGDAPEITARFSDLDGNILGIFQQG